MGTEFNSFGFTDADVKGKISLGSPGASPAPAAGSSMSGALGVGAGALGTAGSLLGGFDGLRQAKSMRHAASRNSHAIIQAALREAEAATKQLNQTTANQRAQFAAGGLEQEGTATAVSDFTSKEAILERETRLAGALQTAHRMKREARKAAKAKALKSTISLGFDAVKIVAAPFTGGASLAIPNPVGQ